MKYPKAILALPDMHFPWPDWEGIEMARKWKDKHKPDLVVQLGDLTDQKIWSRWPSDPDDFSPAQELAEAQKGLKELAKMFPKMQILTGNHDLRYRVRAAESKLPGKMVKTLEELFPAKGWVWHMDPRKKLVVPSPRGKILFVHGDEDGGTPLQKAIRAGMNVVQGHTHRTSVAYSEILGSFVWGFETGNLMDSASKAADYAARSVRGATNGFGVIKHGVPYFIPADGGDV